MSFSNLSVEVHQRIIFYLLSNRDVANLSIQSRTLHSLCDMATRKKYDRICITKSDKNIDHGFTLLMAILKKPSLGYFVRHIDHCNPLAFHEEYEESAFQRELPDEDMRLLRNAVRKAGFTERNEDRVVNMLMQKTAKDDGFGRRNIDGPFITQALAALLVSVSPNLISIAMTKPFFNYTGYYMSDVSGEWGKAQHIDFPLDQLFREANASPDDKSYLQILRKVYVINKEDMEDGRFYQGMDLLGCFTLFDRLPSIEWVGTDILEEDENGKPDPLDEPSNISRISITNSSVGSTYLAKLIVSCKTLKEFRFSIGGRATLDGEYSMFNAKAFIKALSPHRTTLEIMHVDTDEHVHELYDMGGDELEDFWNRNEGPDQIDDSEDKEFLSSFWGNNGSLKEFTALKELSVGIGFLLYFAGGTEMTGGMLADSLPDNLEYLTIFGYEKGEDERIDAQIDKLRGVMKSGTCKLKKVEVIDELIPHAEDVGDPDENEEFLWQLKDLGYESD